MKKEVVIIGAGLAGSEAAYQLAKRGIKVILKEMRPLKTTQAHKSNDFAELVCSNSLKAISKDSSSGLLKEELLKCDSMLIKAAYECQVPAGGALAVDRDKFSKIVTDIISNDKNITIINEEVTELPSTLSLIASGPLTSDDFANNIKSAFGGGLYFADAISPIISADSIDMSKGYFLGRYGKGGNDYFNLPLTEDEYNNFYDELINAKTTSFHDFEDINYFEGCMPIEVMAERGRKTLSFGPMKPVGLENPVTNERPYAVIQLRKENIEGTAFNIVGFQTKMLISEQKRVFGLIKGLENAEFLRYGSVHRNTYINSPTILNRYFQVKNRENLFFAGQITGLEGYVESIAGGLIASLQIYAYINNKPFYEFPINSALGALSRYVSGESDFSNIKNKKYVPSNFHFGLLPPLDEKIRDKKLKKIKLADRSLESISKFINENNL